MPTVEVLSADVLYQIHYSVDGFGERVSLPYPGHVVPGQLADIRSFEGVRDATVQEYKPQLTAPEACPCGRALPWHIHQLGPLTYHCGCSRTWRGEGGATVKLQEGRR